VILLTYFVVNDINYAVILKFSTLSALPELKSQSLQSCVFYEKRQAQTERECALKAERENVKNKTNLYFLFF
jgi:hypothetical protein